MKFIVGLALVSMSAATAAAVLDQDAMIGPTSFARASVVIGNRPPLESGSVVAQSFTAGRSGILDSIDVQVFSPFSGGSVRLSLFTGGAPGGGTFKGTRDVAPASLLDANTQAFAHFDLAALGFGIQAGESLNFTLSYIGGPTGHAYITTGNAPSPPGLPTYNQYVGGNAYQANNGAGYAALPYDIGFRTFVAEGAVPEPANWATMIAGLALTGAAQPRRRAVFRVHKLFFGSARSVR